MKETIMGKATAPRARGKGKATAPVRITPTMAALISSAAGIGFDTVNAYARGIELAKRIGPNPKLLADAGVQYQIGYVAGYLKRHETRTRNLSDEMRFDESRAVLEKAMPESTKPNRRTDLEHRACRAASNSWTRCKDDAGVKAAPKARLNGGKRKAAKPNNTGANGGKVSAINTPRLENAEAANAYFGQLAVAALRTVNINAKKLSPAISTAVQDFHLAMVNAGLIKPRLRKGK
jgi:hypothetical protein